ncbi:MAG: PQQ-binding-like beta-propeller repeat protein [Betaproteobacteria bacterium]
MAGKWQANAASARPNRTALVRVLMPPKNHNSYDGPEPFPQCNFQKLRPIKDVQIPLSYQATIPDSVCNGKWTFAIDIGTGQQIWRTPVELDPDALAHACCGAINRGAATIYNGKLFRVTLDAHVVALDMKTGSQVWKQKFADFAEGYSATSAPLIANGVLITGMAGGEAAQSAAHHAERKPATTAE